MQAHEFVSTHFVSVDTGNANRESTEVDMQDYNVMFPRNILEQTSPNQRVCQRRPGAATHELGTAENRRGASHENQSSRAPWRGSRGSTEGDLQSNPRSVHLSMQDALEDEQGDMAIDKHVVAIKQRHDKQTNKHTA